MSIFTKHKIDLPDLIKLIPEELFSKIAADTQVDYCSKVLYGKVMFYLLLHSLMSTGRLGQRGIAELYASSYFRVLFNLGRKRQKLSHSSVSERLSKINPAYFSRLYEIIKARCSSQHPAERVAGLKLERVDSSLVVDVSNRMKEYLTCGNRHKKGKMLKYTITYDGMYGTLAEVHTEEKYASESLALPENVKKHFKKNKDHSSVYVIDRGQSSTEAFREMSSTEDLRFVGRLMENRKLSIVKEFDLTFKRFGDGRLKQDAIVQLYGSEHVTAKDGKTAKKLVLREEKYRIIRFRPEGRQEDILLITNIFNLRAETVARMYRRRWDIEVFFRFLKQELSFSHFVSLNRNGIEVMLYMTLITAMLLMIYRKENGIGFRTAKRRMLIELQDLTLAAVAVISGGDPKRIDLWSP